MPRRQAAAVIIVASGPGWALYWPRDLWATLSQGEQAAVIANQTRLMEAQLTAAD